MIIIIMCKVLMIMIIIIYYDEYIDDDHNNDIMMMQMQMELLRMSHQNYQSWSPFRFLQVLCASQFSHSVLALQEHCLFHRTGGFFSSSKLVCKIRQILLFYRFFTCSTPTSVLRCLISLPLFYKTYKEPDSIMCRPCLRAHSWSYTTPSTQLFRVNVNI